METANNHSFGFCRGCLTSGFNMKSLFAEPYQQHFTDLTNIELSEDDTLSSWLCTECYMIVCRLKRFMDKVKLIDTVLKNHSNTSKLDVDELTKISNKYNEIKPSISLRDIFSLQACSDCCKSDVTTNDEKTIGFISTTTKLNYTNNKIFNLQVSNDNTDTNSNDSSKPKIEKFEHKQENVDNFVDIGQMRTDERCESSSTSPTRGMDDSCDDGEFPSAKIYKIKKKKCNKPKRAMVATLLKMANSQFTVIELTPEEQIKELNDRRTSENYFTARYKCELCIKVFPYEESLRNHSLRHEESYGNCECDICHQRFNNKRLLKNHCRTHARRYKCRTCDKLLHFKTTMAHHLLRHDNTYICRICGHHSTDKFTYRLHQKEHSSTDTFDCPMCSKTLVNKYDYGIHIRRHTGDMPFVCDKCKKCFQTSTALESHKAVHSSMRGYYCAECDVSFKTRETLVTHFKKSIKHIDPALLNISCTMCSKKFESSIQLEAHVDNFHLRRAKMSCDICPAQFVSANGLRNHRQRKHEGLRPPLSHVCETCGRGFTTKALVTNHLRTHTGEKPFECQTCHRRFTQKSAMQTHIKLVHLKIKRNVKRVNSKPQIQLSVNPDEWSEHL